MGIPISLGMMIFILKHGPAHFTNDYKLHWMNSPWWLFHHKDHFPWQKISILKIRSLYYHLTFMCVFPWSHFTLCTLSWLHSKKIIYTFTLSKCIRCVSLIICFIVHVRQKFKRTSHQKRPIGQLSKSERVETEVLEKMIKMITCYVAITHYCLITNCDPSNDSRWNSFQTHYTDDDLTCKTQLCWIQNMALVLFEAFNVLIEHYRVFPSL